MQSEESLEHFIRFSDNTCTTYFGTIEEVMRQIRVREGSQDATDVRSRIISRIDEVVGIGCSNDLGPVSTRGMLVEAVDHARNFRSRRASRPDLGIPLWEEV